ncbi:hypothetical protein [Sphingomonas prati]|uniref:Uncharacterized protein n=1 Tax=Sphingomonas prati TaxID=1843237 RepID=A0A7W9BTZ8_9SPHN|nr:hypothetical protein [Sphingomonas prati]MBB5730080.1 hypothetical protein [Sphingomonas prati]GGE91314.1 hypothetical protein GCM10011404_25300 [Sphingomonas prati]
MARTGSEDLNGIDDAEKPGIEDTAKPGGVTKRPGTWDETETNAAGDLVPREPDDV